MATLKKSEIDALVRMTVIDKLGVATEGTQIGASTFAVEVKLPDGEVAYAKVAITAAQRTDTKATKAFDLETAVAKYNDEVAEKEEKARLKAEAKAAKIAKAEAKKAEKDA